MLKYLMHFLYLHLGSLVKGGRVATQLWKIKLIVDLTLERSGISRLGADESPMGCHHFGG
jgi:hypothetical protein